MEQENIEKKKRGGCLTSFLIVMIVLSSFELLYALFNLSNKTLLLSMLLLIMPVIEIIGYSFVLTLKKIGVYFIVTEYILEIIIALFSILVNTSSFNVGVIIGVVIRSLIFYFLIIDIYKYMD